jgi:hypothetical protein
MISFLLILIEVIFMPGHSNTVSNDQEDLNVKGILICDYTDSVPQDGVFIVGYPKSFTESDLYHFIYENRMQSHILYIQMLKNSVPEIFQIFREGFKSQSIKLADQKHLFKVSLDFYNPIEIYGSAEDAEEFKNYREPYQIEIDKRLIILNLDFLPRRFGLLKNITFEDVYAK